MLGVTTTRRRRCKDQPDRKDKLARPEIRARQETGAARDTLETRGNQARPEIWARPEIGAAQDTQETRGNKARPETEVGRDTPETRARRDGPATRAKRDAPATRVYKVRPRHVQQESIAIRTTILEERVVSGIKTGLSSSF